MRDSSFMSSHPTGVPGGLTDLAPVIVNQSPELASRRGFENQQYEEELQIRGHLFEKKHASSMDQYGGISNVDYRGSRDQEHLSQPHAGPYLGHNHSSFTSNASAASFDLPRSSQHDSYNASQQSPGTNYSSIQQYGRLTAWQPQYGPPGTEVRINLLTNVRIDPQRQLVARFAREDTHAICQGGHEHTAPYSYLITAHAPAQVVTQWSKPKSAISLCLLIPYYENMQTQLQSVGTFTYTETSAAASPSESELDHPRRSSEAGYLKYEAESPRHGNEYTIAQLPPIRATHAPSTAYYASSTYSTSGSSDEYPSQASASSYYAPSLVGSYGQTPGCTPPTPSWTGTASSTATMDMSSSTLASVPQSLSRPAPVGQLPTPNRTTFLRVTGSNSQHPSMATNALGPFNRYPQNKANLIMSGDLREMTQKWTVREKADGRRLVQFHRSQIGGDIHASWEAVHPDERNPSLPVISCIWWDDKQDYYVTSVDTIGLLEKLVVPGESYSTEEKNRIRRNLEGFRPLTVKKDCKPEETNTTELFKLIMNFPVPRPRHIEKDIKVFQWKELDRAMKKIVSKYVPSVGGLKRGHGETELTPKDEKSNKSNSRDMGHHQYSSLQSAYHPSMPPLSTTSSTFSDSYAQSYPSYSQPATPSYPSYPQQHSYATGGGMQDSSHMMLQQHRLASLMHNNTAAMHTNAAAYMG